jgi:3-oxoacyl-[acyl-carrier-protein] synthase III
MRSIVRGIGAYAPKGRLTNNDLEQMVVTSDEWITSRTGILERTVASPDQATSDLAFEAATAALADAGMTAQELDLILVATETPDHPFPPVACQLQHMLGARPIAAFDIHLVCTGFVAALHTADAFIRSEAYRHILVVGADTLTRVTDYTDRSTCILFSDGAGAVVLSAEADEEANVKKPQTERRGILHSAIHADGEHFEAAIIRGGGSRYPDSAPPHKNQIEMDGNKIFKLAVHSMSDTARETLAHVGLSIDDVDWVVPHQANQRIMDAVARNLSLPPEKLISHIAHMGNNSAATIPTALDAAVRDGRIRRGDLVLLTAFGGGLAWGSVLLRW